MKMEGKNQGVPSPPPPPLLTADLFGTKESPASSSAGIFASIFPPPSKVLGRKTEVIGTWQKSQSGNQEWNTKQGTSAMNGQAASDNMPNKDRNSIVQEGRVEPCHLSSSIYYGGQDNYCQSSSTQTAGSYPIYKKDGGEDDPNGSNSQGASRGNWWQGSLYY